MYCQQICDRWQKERRGLTESGPPAKDRMPSLACFSPSAVAVCTRSAALQMAAQTRECEYENRILSFAVLVILRSCECCCTDLLCACAILEDAKQTGAPPCAPCLERGDCQLFPGPVALLQALARCGSLVAKEVCKPQSPRLQCCTGRTQDICSSDMANKRRSGYPYDRLIKFHRQI